MGTVLWLLLGLVVGGGLGWFVVQRLSDRRVAEAEARVASELAHARAQAQDADLAHAETKERLIALQGRVQELEAELERERAALMAARNRIAALECRLGPAPEEPPVGAVRPAVGAEVSRTDTAPPAPSPSPSAGVAEELRKLEAKLAMLPAGSSARALLLKRRAELVARVEHPPVPKVDQPPVPSAQSAARGAAPARDDLKQIKGIGPVLERKLHELGVHSFADLAALTPERIREIDAAIEFPGRIERERWVEQAKELLARRGGASTPS